MCFICFVVLFISHATSFLWEGCYAAYTLYCISMFWLPTTGSINLFSVCYKRIYLLTKLCLVIQNQFQSILECFYSSCLQRFFAHM